MRLWSYALVVAVFAIAGNASAFCGFYVAGADDRLFNNATQVVLMRDGLRTVLSMQNNYQGPPEDFAMVVPVPVILQKDKVKTLPASVFDRVDRLGAPRLVEYWEQDPCVQDKVPLPAFAASKGVALLGAAGGALGGSLGVRVEAQFAVGEYDVVILSARDSTGLETWLRINHYKIPSGAEPYLRPYVQEGMRFFVAKVDVAKVRFEGGQAVLSPLRFHYDSDTFTLPIRLGLINSQGTQDLIVNILARGQRYEVANYDNLSIPTNLDVADEVRDRFGAFYAALFDRTLQDHPRAIVTEYAWSSSSCDPCPIPALGTSDLLLLGADSLPSFDGGRTLRSGFVLTRLHARYAKESLGEDLVFRPAPPIAGGREVWQQGALETGAIPSSTDNFQARYAIRHSWTGPIDCSEPHRGVWGPPPGGVAAQPKAAVGIAYEPRGNVDLGALLRGPVAAPTSLGSPTPSSRGAARPGARGGCLACAVTSGRQQDDPFAFALVLGGLAFIRRRQRCARHPRS